jgi:hypothetical protein
VSVEQPNLSFPSVNPTQSISLKALISSTHKFISDRAFYESLFDESNNTTLMALWRGLIKYLQTFHEGKGKKYHFHSALIVVFGAFFILARFVLRSHDLLR